MMGFATHILRRGAEYVQQSGEDEQPQLKVDVSPGAAIALVMTVLLYYVAMFKIRYSIGAVIGTLAIVETPTDTVVEVDSLDEDGKDTKATDRLLEPEVVVIKSRPVTSKIRTAIAHLKARAGRGARFRGISLYIVYGLLKPMLAVALASAIPGHIGRALGTVAAEVALSPLEMTWYQIVISEPSSKRWYQRVLPRNYWSKIAPAALVKAVVFQLLIGIPAAIVCFGPARKLMHGHSDQLTQAELSQSMASLIAAGVSFLFVLLAFYVPAYVAMVRVSASMLPQEDEPIVSMDRTFGGKVTPMEFGGSGYLSILDAAKTFTREARLRFMKLMFKVAAIMFAVSILFCGIIFAEVQLFIDSQTKDFILSQIKQRGSR